MSFVIVLIDSNKIVTAGSRGKQHYATESAAKAGATRLMQQGKLKPDTFAIYDSVKMPQRTQMVTNLLTGMLVEEDVNTPRCCSVASESFWSN